MPTPFDLIIFDCDGVLVDSEPISNQVLTTMLNEMGLDICINETHELFTGHTLQACIARMKERYGLTIQSNFVESFRDRSFAAFQMQLVAVAGIEELLDQLAIPYCVASNGSINKMRHSLGITKLLSRFEGRLYSSDDVTVGKPAPDLFLHAASKLGASPSKSLVIEDTPTGVMAGLAAGMTVFGYAAATPSHRLIEAGAHRVFDDMAQLRAMFESGSTYP